MAIGDRYPDADVLAQRGHWDQATREVILDRVHNVPPFRYFHGHQRATLEALCKRVIPQAHRPPERRVPIAPWIDQRCSDRIIDGFRFDDMPRNEVAWLAGLQGLDQTAGALFAARFVDLGNAGQDEVLEQVQAGDPPGEVWRSLPARRWWPHIVLRQITGVYYAHPVAWDEIGFGGPAYPRGYFALNHGAPEPWETREVDGLRRLADGAARP
jgi:Gluconate 2-dehydrogenase subunit 3